MNKKFKKEILKLYNLFPNGRTHQNKLHRLIITKKDRDLLIKNDFLLQEPIQNNKFCYNLGPNFLPIINSWKLEESSKQMEKMTYLMLLLTSFIVLISVTTFLISNHNQPTLSSLAVLIASCIIILFFVIFYQSY